MEKKNVKTNNKLTKEAKKELNIVSNVVTNNKTTKKEVIKEAKPTKDIKLVKEAKHNDKEVKVNNEVKDNNEVKPVKDDKKEKITLNGRVSTKKQMYILEEHFDGKLDSIIFPTNNGQITGYSIFIAIIFAYEKNKIELILQMKEKYEVLFNRQLQYLNKKQLEFVKAVIK